MRTLDRAEEEPVEPSPSAPVESNISEHDTTQFLFAEIRFADETTEDSLEVVDEDLEEVVEEVDLEEVVEEVVEEKQNPPNQPLPLRRSPRKTKSNTRSIKLVSRVQRIIFALNFWQKFL